MTWNQTNSGLTDRRVISLVIDPNHANTIYCGTNGSGVFKSIDEGNSWSNAGLSGHRVKPLAIDPNNSNTIYAGSQSAFGLLKSTDGGTTWRNIRSGIPETIAIDPNNSDIIFVGSMSPMGGIFRSTDGGTTWSQPNPGFNPQIRVIAIDPENSNIIYAGTQFAGAFKSTDGGSTWNAVNSGLTDTIVNAIAIAIDPGNLSTIYAGTTGTDYPYGNHWWGSIFKSTDGGDSWGAVFSGGSSVKVLAINPNDTNIIYAGTYGDGVIKSTNGGSTWNLINYGLSNTIVNTVAVDPYHSNIIYAGTDPGGIFKSTDGGVTWSQANSGLTDLDLVVNTIAIDPDNPDVIYAGTSGVVGVFKTIDGGNTWNAVNFGLTGPSAIVSQIVISPSNPDIIIIHVESPNIIFKSIDRGSTWDIVNLSGLITTLAIDPGNPDIIYAGTSTSGVSKSTDGGATWNQANSGLTEMANTIVVDPSDSNIVYAGTFDFVRQWGSVFKSTDGGGSWSFVITGLTNAPVNAIAIHPDKPYIIYAGTDGAGVLKSINGGATWHIINLGITNPQITAISIDAANPKTVYVGTRGGVFKSQSMFGDVPFSQWAYDYITAIYFGSITQGCGSNTYCPDNPVTREQMASFIVRAVDGINASNCTESVFTDVNAGNPHCANIERLRELNITQGCGANLYCPMGNVTREQMAAFLVRAKVGEPALGLCDTGSPFADVFPSDGFCRYIKKLLELNITQGCGAGLYCPSNDVLRDQMAAFLARAFLGMP
jgi:photosystem II stability/assembly factor-like uncharacterized protein